MPAQRFIIGPDRYSQRVLRLYTIAERLNGRELTYEPHDTKYAKAIIDGSASYLLRALTNPDRSEFLYDTPYPWQHSVVGDDCILHDVGLEFARFDHPRSPATLRKLGVHLVHWAEHASIEPSDDLLQLIRKVESEDERNIRLVKESASPYFKRPRMRPQGIDLWQQ